VLTIHVFLKPYSSSWKKTSCIILLSECKLNEMQRVWLFWLSSQLYPLLNLIFSITIHISCFFFCCVTFMFITHKFISFFSVLFRRVWVFFLFDHAVLFSTSSLLLLFVVRGARFLVSHSANFFVVTNYIVTKKNYMLQKL
jgi:hypothetical protein